MALVENYAGVEPNIPFCPTPPETDKRMTFSAARCLLRQAELNPGGSEARLLEEAESGVWTLELQRHGTLLINYDEVVGTMNSHLESPDPMKRLFGQYIADQLVANLVPVHLVGDGR